MVEGNSFWIGQRQSARQSHNFNCLDANATVRQPECSPVYVNPHNVSSNVAQHRYSISNFVTKINDEGLFTPRSSFPHIESSLPTTNLYQNNQLLLGRNLDCQQKKFLIFDRSGEETRMLLSTLRSPICNPGAISSDPVSTYEFPKEQSCPKLPDLFEDSGENYVTDEISAYHEDTEEINALLYSDDAKDDFCDSEDEDEISTDHSPIARESSFENLDDEVTSLGRSSKRLKLLNGDSCCKVSLADTKLIEKSAALPFKDENTVDLRSRGHKIRDTVRILQKLIPGSKSKDPLIVIDEAIDYLKSLKVKSLHTEETEGSSWLEPSL